MESVINISVFPLGMINCFLIRGNRKHILVDTGVPKSETKILSQIKSHGIDKNAEAKATFIIPPLPLSIILFPK